MKSSRWCARGVGLGRRSLSVRRGRSVIAAAAAVLVAGGAWSACEGPESLSGSGDTEESASSSAVVERVIDGDTFAARDRDGKDLGRVRILGIDTPELSRDGGADDCWAREATAAAEDHLRGRTVTLTGDPGQPDQDAYGRLLRYVDVSEVGGATEDVSETLIRDGAARRTTEPDRHQRHRAYVDAEEDARQSKAGLWAQC